MLSHIGCDYSFILRPMKFREVVFLIVIGILLACVGYLTFKTVSGSKRIKILTQQLTDFRTAPAIIDTVIDTIRLPGKVTIIPVPVTSIVHDTVITQIKENWYDSTYTKNGIRFRWSGHTMGDLRELTFSDFVFPKVLITERKPFDTCYEKEPAYKAKFLHYGLYTEMVAANFTEFPSIGLGGQFIFKDKLTVSLGGIYLDGLKGNLRIGILF